MSVPPAGTNNLNTSPTQSAENDRSLLISQLWNAKRWDECLQQVDLALAQAVSPAERTSWAEVRINILAEKGDTDGLLATYPKLLALTTDPERRRGIQIQAARRAALASRWTEAAQSFDAAVAEIPANATDAAQRQQEVLVEKIQTLAPHNMDLVKQNLEDLDAGWTKPEWPMPIDLHMSIMTQLHPPAEALTWLEARLARTPSLADHPAAHQLRGDVLLKQGNIEEGMAEYARAVELAQTSTEPRAIVAALSGSFGSQRWADSKAAYEKLEQLDPPSANDPSIRIIGAQAYLRLGQFEKVLTLTDNAKTPVPNLQALRDVSRSEAFVGLGRNDDALATSAEALARWNKTPGAAPEFLVSLNLLRAQAFNQKEEFESACEAATTAIEVPDKGDPSLPGLPAFVRLGAHMQRSLSYYRLGKTADAERDIDSAIKGFDRLRQSPIVEVLRHSPEFDSFETQLWYAKGAVLDSENRNEEALAAYTRAAQLEKHGAAAAIARGYALSSTGAFKRAMASFETALVRATSPQELASAFAGKGRALIRLERYEEAIGALQSALDAQLTEPDNDPVVFEQLGIAYNSLQRHGAARRAFSRAWDLTPEDKRSDNLARGVTAAHLRLGDPQAALDFLDKLPAHLVSDRTLQFNRALALDALGRRRAAIRFLVNAREAGLDRAQVELDRLDAPAGLGRWTHYWFGEQVRPGRRAFGTVLMIIAATGLAAPLFQWWLNAKFDWYLLLLPSVVALLLLALPNMKSITIEAGKVKLSAEPLPATGRDAAAIAAPETFNVPTLAPMSVSAPDSRFP